MTNTVFRPQVLAVVIFAALVAQGFPASPAVARTSIQVNVGIGGPVFEGLSEPDVVVLPGTRSYYVPGYADADVYRSGPWWYSYRDGRWLRAPGHRGPWSMVGYRIVPREVCFAPVGFRHWRHGHPGQGWRSESREDRREGHQDWHEDRGDDKRHRHEEHQERHEERKEGHDHR